MSSHSLRSSNSSENESSDVSFKVDDYLTLHEELQEGYPPSTPSRQQNPFLQKLDIDRARKSGTGVCDKSKSAAKNSPIGSGFRIAFRTKSQIEILDDGYKWRKYGKKMMKNSMNPRNYYRCSSMGCDVKKRVERARDDPNYVITTYEGVHNHQAPLSKEACLGPPDPSPCFYHFSS